MNKFLIPITLILLRFNCFGQEPVQPNCFIHSHNTGDALDPSYTGTPGVLSNTNHTVTNVGGRFVSLSVQGITTDSICVEVVVVSGHYPDFGIATHGVTLEGSGGSSSLGFDPYGWGYLQDFTIATYKSNNSVHVAYGTSINVGDTIEIMINGTTGCLYFGKNGTYIGNPSSGSLCTGAAYTGLNDGITKYIAISNYGGNSGSYTLNASAPVHIPSGWHHF